MIPENNLARILAITDRAELKGIHIVNKTLTITNSHILIRRYIDLPDGFYNVDAQGCLVRIQPIYYYPHVDKIESLVNEATIRSVLTPQVRGQMAMVCHEAKQHKLKLTLSGDGIWVDDPDDKRIGGFTFFFNLPFEIALEPGKMNIALNELARYDDAPLLHSGKSKSPLVIGHNWGSCVLLMPLDHHFGRMEDDIQRKVGYG